MLTTINIHNVKAIKVKEINSLTDLGFTRNIIITDENGHQFEISLFSDDLKELSLLIKEN